MQKITNLIAALMTVVAGFLAVFLIVNDTAHYNSQNQLKDIIDSRNQELERIKSETDRKMEHEKRKNTQRDEKIAAQQEEINNLKNLLANSNTPANPQKIQVDKDDKKKNTFDKRLLILMGTATILPRLKTEWGELKNKLNLSQAQYDLLMAKLEEFYDGLIKDFLEGSSEEDLLNVSKMREKLTKFLEVKTPELEKILTFSLTAWQYEEYKVIKKEQYTAVANDVGTTTSKNLTSVLSLTPQQEQSVNGIVTKYMSERLKPLELFMTPMMAGRNQQMMLLDDQLQLQVKTVLTPEQTFTFDEHVKKLVPKSIIPK